MKIDSTDTPCIIDETPILSEMALCVFINPQVKTLPVARHYPKDSLLSGQNCYDEGLPSPSELYLPQSLLFA